MTLFFSVLSWLRHNFFLLCAVLALLCVFFSSFSVHVSSFLHQSVAITTSKSSRPDFRRITNSSPFLTTINVVIRQLVRQIAEWSVSLDQQLPSCGHFGELGQESNPTAVSKSGI